MANGKVLFVAMMTLGLALASGQTGLAGVVTTGSISDDGFNLKVGYSADGWLGIDSGSQVNRTNGYLGYNPSCTGTATVTGIGSILTTSGNLYVGQTGTGTLNVLAGGQVTSTSNSLYIGNNPGSLGSATVTGTGSALAYGNSLYLGYSGNGTLGILGGGQVSSRHAILGDNTGSTGMATVAGTGSTWTNTIDFQVGVYGPGTLDILSGGLVNTPQLAVGYWGNGAMNILSGGQASSYYAWIGTMAGSTGTATVTGAGSKWTNGDYIDVGYNGGGTLNIQAGGQVSNVASGSLGTFSGSTGKVTVTGPGSTWTNGTTLSVGSTGSGWGTLSVADGGEVTATGLTLSNSQSSIRFNVSGNNMLVLGNATTTGSVGYGGGTINFYADTSLAAGPYTPISPFPGKTITWSNAVAYNAYGGTWNSSSHTFTASAVTPLSAGLLSSNPVSSGERMLITDGGTGKHVGASFGSVAAGTTFSAALMTQSELDGLAATPGFSGNILSAWDFNTNVTGGPVLLSYDIGLGEQNVEVWHLSGGVWTPFTPDMLTYGADGIASFTATSFSGYAVTGVTATPEPATLALLAVGGLAMLGRSVRRRG